MVGKETISFVALGLIGLIACGQEPETRYIMQTEQSASNLEKDAGQDEKQDFRSAFPEIDDYLDEKIDQRLDQDRDKDGIGTGNPEEENHAPFPFPITPSLPEDVEDKDDDDDDDKRERRKRAQSPFIDATSCSASHEEQVNCSATVTWASTGEWGQLWVDGQLFACENGELKVYSKEAPWISLIQGNEFTLYESSGCASGDRGEVIATHHAGPKNDVGDGGGAPLWATECTPLASEFHLLEESHEEHHEEHHEEAYCSTYIAWRADSGASHTQVWVSGGEHEGEGYFACRVGFPNIHSQEAPWIPTSGLTFTVYQANGCDHTQRGSVIDSITVIP